METKQQKKLVVYYSLDGNTRFIANNLAEAVGADILELKPQKDLASKGFMKYFLGGMKAIFKDKPKLKPFDKNPNDYDIIYIGTPVWGSTNAPALNTFLSSCKLTGKKIALFCCCGSGKGKAIDNLKKALSGNNIIGEAEFRNPLDFERNAASNRAKRWAQEVIEGIE